MQVFCPHNSDIVSGEDIDFCGLRQEVSSCLVIVVRGQALTRGSLLLRAEMITSWTTPLSPVSPRRIKKIVTTWNLKIGGSWAEGKGGGRWWHISRHQAWSGPGGWPGRWLQPAPADAWELESRYKISLSPSLPLWSRSYVGLGVLTEDRHQWSARWHLDCNLFITTFYMITDRWPPVISDECAVSSHCSEKVRLTQPRQATWLLGRPWSGVPPGPLRLYSLGCFTDSWLHLLLRKPLRSPQASPRQQQQLLFGLHVPPSTSSLSCCKIFSANLPPCLSWLMVATMTRTYSGLPGSISARSRESCESDIFYFIIGLVVYIHVTILLLCTNTNTRYFCIYRNIKISAKLFLRCFLFFVLTKYWLSPPSLIFWQPQHRTPE